MLIELKVQRVIDWLYVTPAKSPAEIVRKDLERPEKGQSAVYLLFTPLSARIASIFHRVFHRFR